MYDCELYFSLLVQRCGYKPDALTAEGAFQNIDALAAIKKMRDRPFWITMSNSSTLRSQNVDGLGHETLELGFQIDLKCDTYKAWAKG